MQANRVSVLGALLLTSMCGNLALAWQGLTPLERREMREEGYSQAEINEYNREMIREQNGTLTPLERSELKSEGYTPADIAAMQREMRAEAQAERKLELLDLQYERGAMTDAQYERRSEQIEKQAYIQAYGPVVGAEMWKESQEEATSSGNGTWTPPPAIDRTQFVEGLQQELSQTGAVTAEQAARMAQFKESNKEEKLGLEHARFARDYVIKGDKPFEAERGLHPRINLLKPEKPQWMDALDFEHVSRQLGSDVTNELFQIMNSLPEEASLANAGKLAGELRAAGKEPALVGNLIAAIGDGDLKRLSRNALLLGIAERDVSRLSLAIAFDDLSTKFEGNAKTDEIRRLCTQIDRFIRGAELKDDVSKGMIDWLSQLPELLDLREVLERMAKTAATGEPNWPKGEVEVVMVPGWDFGKCRLMPNGWLVCGVDGTLSHVVRKKIDCRVALGLPLLRSKLEQVSPPTSGSDPKRNAKPFITLSASPELKEAVRYSLRIFQKTKESWGLDAQTMAWPAYSINPGKSQVLPISQERQEGYLIELLPSSEGGSPSRYFMAPEPGKNLRFEIVKEPSGALIVKQVKETCTLDNRQNANPFHYMVGLDHKTVRPGGKEDFDSSVIIRYCESESAKSETSMVLRANETAYVGLANDDRWAISKNMDWIEIDRTGAGFAALKSAAKPLTTEAAPKREVVVKKGTLYVISIGVSHYENSQAFPALDSAQTDAKRFDEAMKLQLAGYEKVEATLLLNQDATAFKIRDSLISLINKVEKEDVVAIFLSGRAKMEDGVLYFCPFDASMKEGKFDFDKALSSGDIKKITDNLRCNHAWLMHDSRFSDEGFFGFRELVAKQGKSGLVVFASATEKDGAGESGQSGGFTPAMLETLSDQSADENRNRYLEVVELDKAVKNKVAAPGEKRWKFHAEYTDKSKNFQLIKMNSGG